MHCTATSEHDLTTCARQVLEHIRAHTRADRATVVGLRGDLGAGKTALTRAIARLLGVGDHITSPTFVLEKRYVLTPATPHDFTTLVHVDAYRLEGASTIAYLDWERTLSDPSNLVIVEWPDCIASSMPDHTFMVTLEHVDENTRRVSW